MPTLIDRYGWELRSRQSDAESSAEALRRLALALADDDYDGTEDARMELAEARVSLDRVAGAVERARNALSALDEGAGEQAAGPALGG